MIKNINKIKVLFNERTVGYLEEKKESIAFEYDEEWLKTGFNISPFKLPLIKQAFYSNPLKFDGLFGVFNDSLPDGWGTLLSIKALAKIGIDYEKLSPVTKLSLIKNNSLGGLSYQPSQAEIEINDKKYDLDMLSEQIDKMLNEDNESSLDDIYNIGGSSGGARPKAHITIEGEDWIIKFPTHLDKSTFGLDEYKANMTAKESGIHVNEFKLFPSQHFEGYFGAKRFDKENNRRKHVISLSGLLEVNHRDDNLDYHILFQVIESISCKVKQDKIEAYRRMCFNVLYGNKDDHAKNWAFVYDEKEKGYRLSPFYDITKTPHLLYRSMLVFGKENPNEHDLIEDAKLIGIDLKTAHDIIDKIKLSINK